MPREDTSRLFNELDSMSDPSPQTAVLLIAHGSRRAAANDDLVELAKLVSERGGYRLVEVSYLELAEPTIAAGGRRCVERGARRVLMLPYFLSAGVHVVNDLEAQRASLAAEFSETEFVLCPHLGLHPLMAEIVLQRLQERGGECGVDI
jgi:sirohydrochlorin ferrochelatase